jgi:hypothetical protein
MNLSIVKPFTAGKPALYLAQRQAYYDRLHHLLRVEWLSQEKPCYSCGTPVPESEKQILLELSKITLQLPSMAHNHCDINYCDYVAILDEFALSNGL